LKISTLKDEVENIRTNKKLFQSYTPFLDSQSVKRWE